MVADFELHLGDCLDTLRAMPDESVDAIVTDPPYGLSFMGRKWDYDVPSVEVWAECLRVLRPGGHLLAFAGTRTQHRMAVRIEDAGFEIRDMIAWVYGSGFPKSLDVSKAIDKAGGVDARAFKADLRAAVDRSGMTRKAIDEACGFAMRFDTPYEDDPRCWGVSLPSPEKWETICRVLGMDAARWSELVSRVWRGRAGKEVSHNGSMSGANYERTDKGDAVHDAARQWQGWGTALKPALEPITVARKPLRGTVAENVLQHGTGAINVDGCRVVVPDGDKGGWRPNCYSKDYQYNNEGQFLASVANGSIGKQHDSGRWPANLIHDGSDEVLVGFPTDVKKATGQVKVSSGRKSGAGTWAGSGMQKAGAENTGVRDFGDTGSAARFFYCAKASKADRNSGGVESTHPTVKPTDLMRYLCRLVTPPGGVVLDPFMGSGSTGKAAVLEGFKFIGCELSAEYLVIAKARISNAKTQIEQAAEAASEVLAQECLF